MDWGYCIIFGAGFQPGGRYWATLQLVEDKRYSKSRFTGVAFVLKPGRPGFYNGGSGTTLEEVGYGFGRGTGQDGS